MSSKLPRVRRLTDPALRCGSSALSALSDATEWERRLTDFGLGFQRGSWKRLVGFCSVFLLLLLNSKPEHRCPFSLG